MSKLFDQLKNAARDREERAPGLLVEAMQRAKTVAPPVPGDAPAPAGSAEGNAAQPASASGPAPPPAHGSYAGIALAVAIFAAVVVAWNAAPWRAPQKIRIDPAELKLDRTLDLQRPSPKGTSSPSRPS